MEDLFEKDPAVMTTKAEVKEISGYAIYAPQQKERTVVNNLPEFYPELPEGKFDIVYCDPPWDYGGKMQFDKSSIKSENKDWKRDVFISAANFKYPTVKTKELKKIPIQDICADDCLLFMWVTNPHLAQGIELGQAWGFEYKTVGFVWDKCNHNPGQYTLSNCELCLIFKKGRIPQPRGARNVQQLVRVPRTEHSVKPIEVLHNIEKMFPSQRKIELFARHKPEGWTVWGLDVRPVYKEDVSSEQPEIYLDGEKISASNPFGFSVYEPETESEPALVNETYTFEGSVELTDDVMQLFRPKDAYQMVCTEIDGLKYTFTNGEDIFKFELKEMQDNYKDIKVGSVYDFKFDQS